VIQATIFGTLQGPATDRGNGRVTARLYAATAGGLPVDVNVSANGAAGATLLRIAAGDGVEVSGTLEPRVRMDQHDNAIFLFDVTAWTVKRLADQESARKPQRRGAA
jgi:hypothetical protein